MLPLPSVQATHLICQEAKLLQEVLAQSELVSYGMPLHLSPEALGLLSHAVL